VLLHHICTVNGQELLDQTATTMKDDNTTTIISDDNSSSNISSNTESTRMDNIIVIPISPTATPSDYILFPWFVELLGCWSLFLLTRFNVPIPYAAVMFIIGAIMGGVSTNLDVPDTEHNALHVSITEWINFDSELLLMVFLPGLLFKEAVEVPINLFQIAFVQILILAFPMVLVGTALVGVAGYYILPYQSENPELYGPWAWLTLGSILASTDPIAVAAVLKTAGASPRLVMHIAGESLMNDGSSYVFFMIASSLWYKQLGLTPTSMLEYDDVAGYIGYFFQMSLGGIGMGLVFGFALLVVLRSFDRRLERQYDILQVVLGLTTAYLCFYVCDQMLDVSGIMAVVTCGLVINRFGKGMINDEELMHSYLSLAEFLLNTLLFAIGGLIWAGYSFASNTHYRIELRDIGWLFLFYILMLVIRFVQLGLFYPILSRIGLKSNWKEGVFLAYGGLHGSVGIALGLSLVQQIFKTVETDDLKRDAATIIQFFGGGGTLFTLLINGTSAGFVLKRLGLSKPPMPAEHVKHIFEGAAKDFVYTQMSHLLQEPRFRNVSFDILKDIVPFVTKKPPRIPVNGDIEGGQHNHDTIRQFNQIIAGDGKQYMSLINAAKRASNHDTSTVECEKQKQKLLIEMRQIFLELVREAYKLSLNCFELDHKQHSGFLYELLVQSTNLAINDVRYENKPIVDWQHTEIFVHWKIVKRGASSSSVGMPSQVPFNSSSKLESNLRRRIPIVDDSNESNPANRRESAVSLRSSLMSLVTLNNNAGEKHSEKAKISMKRLRIDVLRAIAFKRGHEMAESKLQLYVNRFDDEENATMQAQHEVTASVLKQVLSESRDQVRFADKMLEDEVSDKDLNIILSYYCAKIVIRRLSKFTEIKAEDGLISKQEARKYLRSLKEKSDQSESRTVELLAELRLENHHQPRSQQLSNLENSDNEKDAENKHSCADC